jgi:DNA-binding NtrC family response regulator
MSRILIVDDEPGFAELMGTSLERRGHEIRWCERGTEALAHLAAEPPELLVLDWILGQGMEREQILQEVAARCPECRLLIVTGLRRDQLSWTAPPTAAWEVLEKPFTLESLCDAVDGLLTK